MLELIGQIIMALAAVVVAQFGSMDTGRRDAQPSVQRTVSKSVAEPSPQPSADPECEQEARLQSA